MAIVKIPFHSRVIGFSNNHLLFLFSWERGFSVVIVKIPFHSRVIGFSNNHLLFLFSWERGFSIGNSGTEEPSMLHWPRADNLWLGNAHTDYIYV